MVLSNKAQKRLTWWAFFIGAMCPLLLLVLSTVVGKLGADPAKEIVLELGLWAAVMLWLSLAASTLRRRVSFSWLMRYRRMLGLYAFCYAVLHFLAFATFIVGWRIDLLVQELVKRPYIVVGALAIIMLVPLVLTSTKGMQRRLGRRWVSLHKLVYVVALLVLLHIVWMVRASYFDAVVFGGLLLLMYGDRLRFEYLKYKSKKV